MNKYGPFTDRLTALSYLRRAKLPIWVSLQYEEHGCSFQVGCEIVRSALIDHLPNEFVSFWFSEQEDLNERIQRTE